MRRPFWELSNLNFADRESCMMNCMGQGITTAMTAKRQVLINVVAIDIMNENDFVIEHKQSKQLRFASGYQAEATNRPYCITSMMEANF